MKNVTENLARLRWAQQVAEHPHRYSYGEIKRAFDILVEL